ncbi:hypothetical protein TVAG_182850 [Trichomonas vaginalis G3]|uniref:Uncharacterized protein n=1 Tax=Trichomonas vaginalis (strain ATCC PRA-98 / G3) TaxID=412133 RepID=A2D923_TRIV3|nr:armadillo (ARM) repeat-containing protein family [Trichomonas vaginalis G3]EAY23049.1 hypothetical protein TVAG_182850 [Trichomonas vaginalis G3]KAI5519018.1 armadillo (ARM) repeat-containing protein family [Trichomonas vaginalis G3]|eukprot:XP_001584035.1 hypothetical protein [Trichomonas vaginalis G3]
MSEKVINKIIKNLKSANDNDKLAALMYLTKLFPKPEDLKNSKRSTEIWQALRSTQFLERALKLESTQPLVFSILSVFNGIVPKNELKPFLPLLKDAISAEDSSSVIVEICQNLDDIVDFIKLYPFNKENLPIFAAATDGPKKCSMDSSVYNLRKQIFDEIGKDEDLNIRRYLFLIISHMCRLSNGLFALYSAPNKMDLAPFLGSIRLAFIEIRLQLDVPVNYLEIEKEEKEERLKEEKEVKKDKDEIDLDDEEEEFKLPEPIHGMKFSPNIGPLINPDITAAASQLLENAVFVLLENEDRLSDDEVNSYFETLNTVIMDSMEIVKAANGERDKDRKELQVLLSIIGMWLRDAEFLCANKSLIIALPNLIRLLKYFPAQALQFLPAFSIWSDEYLRNLKVAQFSELVDVINEAGDDVEKETAKMINSKIRGLK